MFNRELDFKKALIKELIIEKIDGSKVSVSIIVHGNKIHITGIIDDNNEVLRANLEEIRNTLFKKWASIFEYYWGGKLRVRDYYSEIA